MTGPSSGAPEWSVAVPLERLKPVAQPFALAADADARTALAARFGLTAIDRLEAELMVRRTADGAAAEGRFAAAVVQACVVSGAPVPAEVAAPLALRFVSMADAPTELELDEEALDSMAVEEGRIDLGEAVAQSLLLALDPYPRAPDEVLADARRQLLSEEEAARLEADAKAAASPFAVLRSPNRSR